jgi:hypothetical protein
MALDFDASKMLDDVLQQQITTRLSGGQSQAPAKQSASDLLIARSASQRRGGLPTGMTRGLADVGAGYSKLGQNLANGGGGGAADNQMIAMLTALEARQKGDQYDQEARADRQTSMDAVAKYEASIGQQINTIMADTVQMENAGNTEAQQRMVERFAQMGRVVSPFEMSQNAMRMKTASSQRIIATRAKLEHDADQGRQYVASQTDRILSNTSRKGIDAGQMASIMSALGQGSASGGSGPSVSSSRKTKPKPSSGGGSRSGGGDNLSTGYRIKRKRVNI